MPSNFFKPYVGVSNSILLFTKAWGLLVKVTKPATEQDWFYNVSPEGYTLDDKRSKQDGFGDLLDMVEQ